MNGCSSGKTAALQIAVFVDGGLVPAVPYQAESLLFYTKSSGIWKQSGAKHIQPLTSNTPAAINSFLKHMLLLVQDTRVIAGKKFSGRAFTVFNQQGKLLFELSQLNTAQLSGIAEDIAMMEAKQALAAEAFAHTRPTETEVAGVYTLDLVTALEDYPALSSKMILKPFFSSVPFTELTVICRHVPNWLRQEKNLRITQKERGEYLVVSIQKQCSEEAV